MFGPECFVDHDMAFTKMDCGKEREEALQTRDDLRYGERREVSLPKGKDVVYNNATIMELI